jgi:hypothetical protein
MNLVYIIVMNTCILFTTFVTSQQDYCGKHASIYNERGSPDNSNNYYFNPDTFSKGEDICKEFSSQTDYRTKIIEKDIICVGDWCNPLGINNGWGCITRGNTSCYHVEHIIPKANIIKGIENCNTSITGNYIMSYGKWNVALRNEFYDEKRIVYGPDIFYQAYKNIYYCCHNKIWTDVIIIPKELICIDISSLSKDGGDDNTTTTNISSTTSENKQYIISDLGIFGAVLTTCLLLFILLEFAYIPTRKEEPLILNEADYNNEYNTDYENMDIIENMDNDIV